MPTKYSKRGNFIRAHKTFRRKSSVGERWAERPIQLDDTDTRFELNIGASDADTEDRILLLGTSDYSLSPGPYDERAYVESMDLNITVERRPTGTPSVIAVQPWCFIGTADQLSAFFLDRTDVSYSFAASAATFRSTGMRLLVGGHQKILTSQDTDVGGGGTVVQGNWRYKRRGIKLREPEQIYLAIWVENQSTYEDVTGWMVSHDIKFRVKVK